MHIIKLSFNRFNSTRIIKIIYKQRPIQNRVNIEILSYTCILVKLHSKYEIFYYWYYNCIN